MTGVPFSFSVSVKVAASFKADGATLAGAFAAGVKSLPAEFSDKAQGLRLFTFDMTNELSGETAGVIGQGYTAAEALDNAIKNSRDSFRPKNDGKVRPSFGLTVRKPPTEVGAVCSTITRSVEEFQAAPAKKEEGLDFA